MRTMPFLRVAYWTDIVDKEKLSMAYMIYQQYASAIKVAYDDNPNVAAAEAKTATSYRRWLQSLDISPHLRDPLVEQARAIEELFAEVARKDG